MKKKVQNYPTFSLSLYSPQTPPPPPPNTIIFCVFHVPHPQFSIWNKVSILFFIFSSICSHYSHEYSFLIITISFICFVRWTGAGSNYYKTSAVGKKQYTHFVPNGKLRVRNMKNTNNYFILVYFILLMKLLLEMYFYFM